MTIPADDTAARAAAESLASRDNVSAVWGMQILEVRAGFARLRMPARAEMLNGHEIVHGGIIFSLADTALAYAANSRGVATVTQQASVVYLSPARNGEVLVAEARERVLVGRTGIYDVDIKTDDGRAIATLSGLTRTLRA